MATHDALAKTFLSIGEEYDRYRPGFPDDAADEIVTDAVDTVLDLGAGTGKFTELLVRRAPVVIAVEPSERMLSVLRRKLPGIDARIGTAEDIPAEDASIDAVTVAQAFHWFDRTRACAEIARILVPGGRLGLLWNRTDRACAWDFACHRVAHPGLTEHDDVSRSAAEELPGFRLLSRRKTSWTEDIPREDYVRRWLTVSSFLAADEEERERMLGAVNRILDEDAETRGREALSLSQITDVFVYERSES